MWPVLCCVWVDSKNLLFLAKETSYGLSMTKSPANLKHNKHIDMTKYVWTQNTRSYETQISCLFCHLKTTSFPNVGIWNLDSLATPAMIIEKNWSIDGNKYTLYWNWIWKWTIGTYYILKFEHIHTQILILLQYYWVYLWPTNSTNLLWRRNCCIFWYHITHSSISTHIPSNPVTVSEASELHQNANGIPLWWFITTPYIFTWKIIPAEGSGSGDSIYMVVS